MEGLYQLEVAVFGYNNPTGRCRGCGYLQGCCDDFESTSCGTTDRHDSYFIYCLRTVGSSGRGCSFFGNVRSDSNEDDGPLDFSLSMVLGLENPITLQGLTDTYCMNIMHGISYCRVIIIYLYTILAVRYHYSDIFTLSESNSTSRLQTLTLLLMMN